MNCHPESQIKCHIRCQNTLRMQWRIRCQIGSQYICQVLVERMSVDRDRPKVDSITRGLLSFHDLLAIVYTFSTCCQSQSNYLSSKCFAKSSINVPYDSTCFAIFTSPCQPHLPPEVPPRKREPLVSFIIAFHQTGSMKELHASLAG